MPAFLVLEPPGPRDAPGGEPDRYVFLPERFSLGAFLLGPLWMIWRRLWLELILSLAAAALIAYALRAIGAGWGAVAIALALMQLLVGLEATTLVRWRRLRRGFRDAGVVVADDLDLAERRFFDSHLAGAAPAPPAPPSRPPPAGVTGLFPEPRGTR